MAKDLPYFKFVISEWNDGDITLCSLEAQGLFINLCSIYWSQEGTMSLAKAKRRFSQCNATAWDELLNDNILKVSGDEISISFLDEQLQDRGKLSEKNAVNATIGWEKRRKHATALPAQSERIVLASNIEEKRREKNKTEEKRLVPPAGGQKQPGLEKREKDFGLTLVPFMEKYGQKTIREFYDYWTEPHGAAGLKMKWEAERDRKGGGWRLSSRLAKWKKFEPEFNTKKSNGATAESVSSPFQKREIHN